MKMASNEPEEQIVLLDFTEKLPSDLLQDKVFFKMINLDSKNPLVQINDSIYQGRYDYAIGTNLIFKEVENHDEPQFPQYEPTAHTLEYVTKQIKMLKCDQIKTPSVRPQPAPESTKVKLNLNWDYKELLKKFEEGTLDLNEMTIKEDVPESRQTLPEPEEMNVGQDVSNLEKFGFHHIEEICAIGHEVLSAYNHLQALARTPVRRKITEEVECCDDKFKKEYEYNSVECKILQRPIFSYFKSTTDNRLESNIDFEGCISVGLIQSLDGYPRLLSEGEKENILKMENFDYLDLPARLIVIASYAAQLEQQVKSNTSEQNSLKDEFDRTPSEWVDVLKRLETSLKTRVKELNACRDIEE